tara:strand:- start:646 stop:1374 length:729 start_codon:yes stop_codon:yes gene_type:complete
MKRKINIGVIGRGKWGKRVINVLNNLSKIQFVYGRKSNYRKFNEEIKWVFVLSSNKSHYKICKFFLENKINVFCEKPLTLNYKQSKHLFEIASKKKCVLYVDDIEVFKNKKIILKNKNFIVRKKMDKGSKISLFERLFYHDIYLIYKKIIKKKFKIKFYKSKALNFDMAFGKMIINFYYDINSPKKIHKINEVNFLNFNGNPLEKMIKYVFKLKNLDLENKNRSLFALKTMNLLKEKYRDKI